MTNGNTDTYGGSTPARVTLRRRALRVTAGCASLLLGLGMFAYVVRDQMLWLALVMYVPLGVVALATIIVHLLAFERRRWKRRVAAIAVALLTGVLWIDGMCGDGSSSVSGGAMRLVQWNVQWGRDEDGWVTTVAVIRQSRPDIVVLSEAPSHAKINDLCAQLGDGWSFRARRNERGSRYWYAIAVVSRWPLDLERDVMLPNGEAMLVRIHTPDGPVRVLAVDGKSDPLIPRTPMLQAVAAHAAAAKVNIIAGDFNVISRSVGFDDLEAAGFTLASRSSRGGWRGTYPAAMPLYDIDHVWVGRHFLAADFVMLDSAGTNHRGQSVAIWRAPAAASRFSSEVH